MEVFAIVGSLAEVVKEDDLAKTNPPTHRVDDELVAARPGVVATTPVVDVVARRRRVVRVALLDRDAGAAPLARAELAAAETIREPSLPLVQGGWCSSRGAAGASSCGPSG